MLLFSWHRSVRVTSFLRNMVKGGPQNMVVSDAHHLHLTYSIAYLDRANYGFAAAAGIDKDLGITHGMSSLIGSLFFLGYFLFQVPGAIYAQRNSMKKLIFVGLIL